MIRIGHGVKPPTIGFMFSMLELTVAKKLAAKYMRHCIRHARAILFEVAFCDQTCVFKWARSCVLHQEAECLWHIVCDEGPWVVPPFHWPAGEMHVSPGRNTNSRRSDQGGLALWGDDRRSLTFWVCLYLYRSVTWFVYVCIQFPNGLLMSIIVSLSLRTHLYGNEDDANTRGTGLMI